MKKITMSDYKAPNCRAGPWLRDKGLPQDPKPLGR